MCRVERKGRKERRDIKGGEGKDEKERINRDKMTKRKVEESEKMMMR